MPLKTLLILCSILLYTCCSGWGFLCHREINRQAVFCLPPELFGFYKAHIASITEKAVNADKRRYIVDLEAPKHFIDIDYYKDSNFVRNKLHWHEAVEKYSQDTLQKHGILPWNIASLKKQLTNAFIEKNISKIINLSADVGHYLGDANVPLHTTQNYNGQLSNQVGIHALWESRIPEIHAENFTYWSIKCRYINNWNVEIWNIIGHSHTKVDSVLTIEKKLTTKYPEDLKYEIFTKGNQNIKTYSKAFTNDYHKNLNAMVERQMRRSIQSVADFWYTCWIDAGQPVLGPALNEKNNWMISEKPEEKDSLNHLEGDKNCEGVH